LRPGEEKQNVRIQKITELATRIFGPLQTMQIDQVLQENRGMLDSFASISNEINQLAENLRLAEEQRLRDIEEARIRAEEEARRRAEEEARRKAEEEARKRAEEEARRKAEEEARIRAAEEAKRKAEEEARRRAEEEARRKAEEEARIRAAEEARRKAEEEARARAAEEARRKAEEEARARAAEEARRKAEEEARARAAEEARRKAEEEARARAAEEARLKAEEEARARAAEEARRKAEEEARARAAEEARRKAEEEARARAAEEARRKAEEEARRKAEEEARRKAEEEARAVEEARRRAEEEARARAAEEAKRKAEEEARRKAEEARAVEEARRRAEEEARARAAEEARRKAEEEARARAIEAQRIQTTEITRVHEILVQSEKPSEKIEAPVFTSPLSDAIIQEGSRFTFLCHVTGTPVPVVTWFKDGISIQNNPDYLTTFDQGLCTLTIEETFAEDSAKYTCKAINAAGSAETSASLSVKETEPEEQLSPPSFVKMLEPGVAREGSTFQFYCKVEGNPLPTVQWFKNYDCIDNSPDYVINYNNGEAILKFERIYLEDKAEYTCKASNQLGIAQSTTNLAVTRKLNDCSLFVIVWLVVIAMLYELYKMTS
jgi:membrane protein involved in colicin uptake